MHLYRPWNGLVPLNIYNLNVQYKNINECNICIESFNLKEEEEIILHCAHRCHSNCFSEWELKHYETLKK